MLVPFIEAVGLAPRLMRVSVMLGRLGEAT